MNLICFPHYTCGGVLCDILNQTFSPVLSHGGLGSIHHAIGKIGDAATPYTTYDPEELLTKILLTPSDAWAGTHCWPGNLSFDNFNQIINITTVTERSKIYRWVRAYRHYYSKEWSGITGIELLDKMRETAKNYLISTEPVFNSSVYNLEFSEVVDSSTEFYKFFTQDNTNMHMERWSKINDFLYDTNLWNFPEVKAYYQAEYETKLKKYYIYE